MSISDLNPFFEEFDRPSTASSIGDPPSRQKTPPKKNEDLASFNIKHGLTLYKVDSKSDLINGTGKSRLQYNIPNWLCQVTYEDGCSRLDKLIDEEKKRISQLQPLEWENAVDYLQRSGGRDFRRGYLALGEKMQLPNLQVVRCLKFSSFHNYLAIGCEEGSLIVLEIDYQKPLHHHLEEEGSLENLQDIQYYVPSESQCRVQMNETLVGHSYDLRCMSWNNANGKLITSDEIGVIIGWGYGENGCWVEEVINDKSRSMIRDLSWSPDGKRVAIAYEDYSEDGSVTGGVLVGYADGRQIFDQKFSEYQVSFIVWYNDLLIWVIVNHRLYVFGSDGELKTLEKGKEYLSLELKEGSSPIISFLLVPKTSWVTQANSVEFIVVFKESCMSLYNSIADKSPTNIHTQITASCVDWSANGLYIVIGGMSVATKSKYSSPQVNLYNYEGKLLQILKLPDKTITSISWNHDSLHLTISTGRHIYFANLRPMYKVASNRTVHCYAYTKDCVNHKISFWNQTTIFTEIIPGKIIDLKCFSDKFVVLFMDGLGIYHVLIFGETGVHIQHLCITTMEPFTLSITKNSIICLAANAILNWNYSLDDNYKGEGQKKLTGALKKTRQVHVDDLPGIIPKPGEKNDHLLKPVIDCARCMHAMRDRLGVVRESGKIQLYALPTLCFLQAHQLDLNGDICQQICFNNEGSRLAILTMNGRLGIFVFPDISAREMDVIFCEGLSGVTTMIWANDMTNHICALEGHNLHIIEDGQVLETITNIPTGCSLANFEDLHISLVNMDQVIENPENPCPSMIIKLPTPTLARVQEALENEDENLDEVLVELNSSAYNHTTLRKMVADEALRQGEFALAESIHTDYGFIRFLEGLQKCEGLSLQRAETYAFLNNYDLAQHYYIQAGKKDLAIKMWTDVGNWERVNFLSGYSSEDITRDAMESHYEKCTATQDWEKALELCSKLEDQERVLECFVALESHDKLIELSERLSKDDPLLHKVGELLAADGLIEEAVKGFITSGNPSRAMKITIDTRQWDLAMKLSSQYNFSFMQPALVKHVKSLIASNYLNPAIQILDRCGKVITAGKLLIWKGLCLLEDNWPNIMEIKKIFVLAAKMLSKRMIRSKRSSLTVTSTNFNSSEELDLEFLIPECHLRMMRAHNEWCWSDPWRGAEALHYLILAQRFIYNGMLGRAFKASLHLRNFEDIIGSERMNTLVALAGIQNGHYSVASNALMKLEAKDEEYTTISFKVFKTNDPQEKIERILCSSCHKSIPQLCSICPECNTQTTMCIFSACPILSDQEKWTCQACSRCVELSKRDRFIYCPLCHSEAS